MTHLTVDTFSSPYIVPNRGEMMIDSQKQASEDKQVKTSELELDP